MGVARVAETTQAMSPNFKQPWPVQCGESNSYFLPLRPAKLADGLGLGSRPTTQTQWIRPAERLQQASTLCWVPRIRLPGDSDLGRFLLCPASQGLIGATIETATIIVLPRWVSNWVDFSKPGSAGVPPATLAEAVGASAGRSTAGGTPALPGLLERADEPGVI